MAGPLAGMRVLELAHERTAYAGKLLADAGADVRLVEPPGGCAQRRHAPFAGDRPDPEQSLSFWHYNTSKRGITLELAAPRGRELARELIARVDVVLEGEDPGRLESLGLVATDELARRRELVWTSITPFGRSAPRADEPATDLTLLAGGGPAWSCGYDDHSLPPVRGGGNQAYHMGGHYAVMALLVAVLERERSGLGQLVDVNVHAACNVTTEFATYEWLVARGTVQRQTGRHATVARSAPTQARCADGRYANTGVPPRTSEEFGRLRQWVVDLGLAEEFPEIFLLEMGMQRPRIELWRIGQDEEATAIFAAGRDAIMLIASRLPAAEFFRQAQERGIPVGVIYSPEEVIDDPHFRARGFPTEVDHPDLGRAVTYPGAPYRFLRTPWRISRRAPRLGEHNAEIYGELGLGAEQLSALRDQRVI
ncbi:MAG TPA: CoA transferase [Candidatus Binatia bacterium]|nr:CoA transferase [Candidatus Binatia bacterium]